MCTASKDCTPHSSKDRTALWSPSQVSTWGIPKNCSAKMQLDTYWTRALCSLTVPLKSFTNWKYINLSSVCDFLCARYWGWKTKVRLFFSLGAHSSLTTLPKEAIDSNQRQWAHRWISGEQGHQDYWNQHGLPGEGYMSWAELWKRNEVFKGGRKKSSPERGRVWQWPLPRFSSSLLTSLCSAQPQRLQIMAQNTHF